MTTGTIATVCDLLIAHDLAVTVDGEYGTIFVNNDVFKIWIEARPGHCDRGRWMWVVHEMQNEMATIDQADMFPRYFFHQEAMVMELVTWIETRMRNVERKRGEFAAKEAKP